MIRALLLCVTAFATASPASAMEQLIPTPYPNAVPGAAPLNPETPEAGAPQTLMRDPYPQTLGAESQGNPPIARHHRQRLVPSTYQRKYRVDHK